jgi:hypothetical protein
MSPILLYVVLIMYLLEHYGKRIRILHGCLFEGWSNRAQAFEPFLPKKMGWPCPVRVRNILSLSPLVSFKTRELSFAQFCNFLYIFEGSVFIIQKLINKHTFFKKLQNWAKINSLNERTKICSVLQVFVYFLREVVCLFFNYWMIKFTIMFFWHNCEFWIQKIEK